MSDCHLSLRKQLQDLRSQLQQKPIRLEELLAAMASLEEIVSNLEREQAETARWLKRLENTQRTLNVHVVAIENSRIFRFLRRVGRPLLDWKARFQKLRPPAEDAHYGRWIEREEIARPLGEWYRVQAEEFCRRPLFSVAVSLHNPRREWLEQAVRSILDQAYDRWELCVYCDASTDAWAREYIAALSGSEPRIRLVRAAEGLGTGEYVVFFHQDDVLSPGALHHLAEAVQKESADLIYSDEDRLGPEGRRFEPLFKPDWSPDLLLSCMYVGRLMAVSRQSIDLAGGLRPGFDGADDYDLVLRLTDRGAAVRHIPQVLYHRRIEDRKPAAHGAERLALEDALRRRGWSATVEDGPSSGLYRVRWHLQGQPLVSLIICSRLPHLLDQCLRKVTKRTDYPHREIVVAEHVAGHDAAMESITARYGARRVQYEGPFHFSRMNNLAVESTDGEILVFLNDDVEPVTPSWLSDLAAQAQRPEIGVAGARLLYPSGALQHAGVTIGIGDGCGHPGRGTYGCPYWKWLDLTRDVSAVTGACLAIRKPVFQQLGGFDDRFPVNYNDTDLCLRAIQAGYRVVYESGAVLQHHESRTRPPGVQFVEREVWYSRWAGELDRGDPFYSPNLTRMREDASLRLDE